LFAGVQYYDQSDRGVKPNPYMRVSDVAVQQIWDLSQEHGIQFAQSRKDDAEAQVYAFRNAMQSLLIEFMEEPRDKPVIHPPAGMTLEQEARWRDEIAPYFGVVALHVENARYTRTRTDWERTEEMGHFDALAAMVYLWRLVSGLRNLNPQPPAQHDQRWFERPVHKPTASELLRPDWRRAR